MKPDSHAQHSLHVIDADDLHVSNPLAHVHRHRDSFSAALHENGAILFRGFDLCGADDFAAFALGLVDDWMAYRDRASKRTVVSGPVLTSTDTPSSYPIALHSESSFAFTWPRKILFFCHVPPDGGGRTPIADTRGIYGAMDPTLREKFERLGVMYYRNFYGGVGMNWREVFQIDDPDELDAYCSSAGIRTEWLGTDHLRTVQVRPAVSHHPTTGEEIWFNHALALSQYSLDANLRNTLLRQVGEQGLPHNTYFGDGTPISQQEFELVKDAHDKNTLCFDWASGDVLLLDNMLMTHGRERYTGKREIYAALADPTSWPDIGHIVQFPKNIPEFTVNTSSQPPARASSHAVSPGVEAWFLAALKNDLDIEVEALNVGFIETGGDSVMAVELLDLAITEFGVEFDLDEFLEAPTIEAFVSGYAAALDAHSSRSARGQ